MKIKKGMLCSITTDVKLREKYRRNLESVNITDEIGFLILSIGNDGLCLASPVFSCPKKDTISVRENYHVGFTDLKNIKRDLLTVLPNNPRLNEAVSQVFDACKHNASRKREKEKREKSEAKKFAANAKEYCESKAVKTPIEIPSSVRKNMTHPLQGGGVNPR